MSVSQKLEEVRTALRARGLTQVEAAGALNISKEHLCRVLAGTRRPAPDLAQDLVRVSGAAVEWHELIPPRKRSRRAA